MAHCFVYNNIATNIVVLVGDHDTDVGTDTPFSSIYTVEAIINHESYNSNSPTNANDIALLRTVNNIRFSRGMAFN